MRPQLEEAVGPVPRLGDFSTFCFNLGVAWVARSCWDQAAHNDIFLESKQEIDFAIDRSFQSAL